nr:hypothetical protein [Acinetobacter sp. Marseille-Q1620]
MTFIVAIQLNDSIIVATDNKDMVFNIATDQLDYGTNKVTKMYAWDKGIIAGTGEYYVIRNSINFFKTVADSQIDKLPECLDISRRLRELEVGKDYFQIQTTKLLCSSYSGTGAQLYTVDRLDPTKNYNLVPVQSMSILLWMFNPNVDTITDELQNLYGSLKDYSSFTDQIEWVNYYISQLAPIYKKQSQYDDLMSKSFDVFFQTKDEYLFCNIENNYHKDTKVEFIKKLLT